MKIVSGIIIIFLILWCLNLLLCRIYCQQKKKQAKSAWASPGKVNVNTSNRFLGKIKLYANGWIRYNLICLGRVPSHHYRNFMLRKVFLMDIGRKVVIYGGFEIRAPWNISIGDGSIIGDEAKLDGRKGIVIGKNVNFSTGVWIWTEQHDVDDPLFESGNSGGGVIIEDYAWLSSRTIVLPRVVVGMGGVLAAGGVATKNLEAYGIYGGIPAKKIGIRNKDLKYSFDGKYLPFY